MSRTRGAAWRFLTIEDATEVFCLKAALDTSEYRRAGGRCARARSGIQQADRGSFRQREVGTDAALLAARSRTPVRGGGNPD